MITIGILSIAALFLFIILRVPIGAALAVVGFGGIFFLSGAGAALGVLATSVYSSLSSYTLSVVPLFVVMGFFAYYTGLSNDVYRAANLWFGWLRGGMAMGTVVACAGFAACSGSSVATGATMTTIAVPEMRRYDYDDRLITGCLAAGGTIGILIPPSICFVIYGIVAEQSIGKLFIAGIIPGILEAAFYLATIYIICLINPKLAPKSSITNVPIKKKMAALVHVWPITLLFILVIGGIYGGIFTPTEAGGIGAFGAFILMILKGKCSRDTLLKALLETGRTTAMVFFIFIGAIIFGYLLAMSQLPMQVASWIAPLPLNRYVLLFFILLLFMVLGCMMDTLAIIMLVVPIIFPTIMKLGFDPIWFGVIIVKVSEIGLITPPVGLNVYVVKAAAPDVPLTTIFKGVLPFLIADIINTILLIVFPQLSIFLPNLMR